MNPPVTLQPGVVFRPIGLLGQQIHRWILISHPVAGCVLAVNLSDVCHNPDAECILKVGDHVCVEKESYVYFAAREEMPCRKMAHVLREGKLVEHYPDLSAEVLDRVMAQAKSTRHIPDAIKIKYGLMKKPKPATGQPF